MELKEGYIICENKTKLQILKELENDNTFFDFKFLTLNELKKKLTFEIKKKALPFLINKYKLMPSVLGVYINNLYLINGFKNTPKINFLKSLYDDLEKENLITKDDLFVDSLKNTNITFINYHQTKELEYVASFLNEENTYYYYPTAPFSLKIFDFHRFETIEDECAFIFDSIYKEIKSGRCVDDIKLCGELKDYSFLLDRYSSAYNIPFEPSFGSNLLGTLEAKEFFNLLKESLSLNEIVLKLQNRFHSSEILNKIIKAINDYELTSFSNDIVYSTLNYILKTESFDSDSLLHKIEVIDPSELETYASSSIYFMNFNVNCPKILKDEDYILDAEKKEALIDTSDEINQIAKASFIASLNKVENLTITFSKQHSFSSEVISPLVLELHMNEIKHAPLEYSFGNNKISDDIYLAKAYEDFKRFDSKNKILEGFYYDNLRVKDYDNKFTGIDNDSLKVITGDKLKLSYSSMDKFYKCPFSYYLAKVLKVDEFTSTLDQRLGTFAHAILEDFENHNDSFNFEESVLKAKNDDEKLLERKHSPKEEFYFNKMAANTKLVVEELKKQHEDSLLRNTYCEKEITISLKDDNLIFTGFIDKIYEGKKDDISYVAIIDYKTGSTTSSLYGVEYGLNMQLPVYVYLLRNSDEFKNSRIAGLYKQKIDIMTIKRDPKKTAISQRLDHLRLDGYTNIAGAELIDTTMGSHLKSFSLTKDGVPNQRSKLISDMSVNALYKQIEININKAYDEIMNGNFIITDKRVNGKTDSCQFCKFKDICFKTPNDIVEIELKKEETEDAI